MRMREGWMKRLGQIVVMLAIGGVVFSLMHR
jgi:hypothetical protein